MTALQHQTMPGRRKALNTPEVLSIICSFAGLSDSARLARTCRGFYHAAVPFIWKNVVGAPKLLCLLGATCPPFGDTPTSGFQTIKLPAAPIDFSRFDFYAQFVSSFDVYEHSPRPRFYLVKGWENLIARARDKPLLPNLSSLILHLGYDYALWIRAFACPSLTKVSGGLVQEDTMPGIAPPMADLAFDILARDCPNLRQLSIFASKYLKHNHQAFQDLLGPIPDTPYIQSLRKLTHLVELTCAIKFLRDNIPVIGTLPELEHMIIYGGDRSTQIRPDDIPSGLFSTLRSLELFKLAHWQVISLLNVPRLVKQITRLKINHEIHSRVDLDDFSDEPEQIADQGEYLASEILSWLKNVPRLSYLQLKLTFTSKDESETDIGRQCLADTFSVLPLETFILTGGHISNWTRNIDTLPAVWPHLTRLELWEEIVHLNDLQCFARLPNLEYLLLGVVFEKVEKTTNELSLSPLRTLRCISSIGDEQLDYITHSGGFLLALFPRLREVEWMREEPQAKHGFRVLNRHIQLHLASDGK